MATTPKGIYYPNNYNEIADIPEDMKKMAESIDEVFENTDSDLSDIKEEQTTQNNRLNSLEVDNTTNKSDILTNKQEINNIKTEQTEQNTNISTNATNIESLQEENENLKKIVSQLPQVEGQGTSITLENTIEAPFTKFDVEGNTRQSNLPAEYTQIDYITSDGKAFIDTGIILGKNYKVDVNFVNNVTKNDEQPIVSIWTTSSNWWNLFINSSGVLDFYAKGHNYLGEVAIGEKQKLNIIRDNNKIMVIKNGESFPISVNDTEVNNTTLKLFKRGDNQGDSRISILATSVYDNNILVRNFIPCKNSNNVIGMYDLVTKTFFANAGTGSFTAGDVSLPTPENPILIKNTGDNENLVNESNINFTYSSVNKVIYDNGLIKTINSPNGQFYEFDEPLESGETYTLTFKFVQGRVNAQGSQDFSIGMYHSGNNNSWQGNLTKTQIANIDLAGKTFTLTHKATDTITGLYIFVYSSPTFVTPLWFNVKVEKGNKASGYSPYGMGSINEKIQNKNVLDYKEIFNNAEDYSSAFKIYRKKLQPNTSYTTSSNFPYTNNETGFIVVNSTDEPSTVNYGLRGEITTTTNSDGIIRIYIRKFSEQQIIPKLENFESGTYYIQTEPGSTATSYVPHEEQDYSIYTQQPFRSIGDVRDKFVKKDGNWFERHYIGEVVLNGTENWNYEGGRFVLNFLISALDISGRQEVYSNYFEYLPSGSADYGIFVYKASNTNSQIYILDKDYTTVEELKTGLSTHNVVVQYLSAEPLDLPCTETQIQQLENKPSTYKDFTIIQSEDETEAYLEVSGIYDLNKLITRTEVLESES